MAKKRVRVFIEGRVQGVFFRAYMRDAARRERVNGWVRNLPDGRVEAVLEGDAASVKKVVEWCHRGSPTSRVDKVTVVEEPYVGEFSDFSIRY
ncbi:MAG: acylphosphatase [Deltaproteobacteria bacterium]|nr:acylphosphatase [Deltaproteobacteria bacterium]MBW2067464.1 acylphosphatase [Deltaproteobacteria bacterium]